MDILDDRLRGPGFVGRFYDLSYIGIPSTMGLW